MSRLQEIKTNWQEMGELSPSDVDWLISEVEVLTAENSMFAEFITVLGNMIVETSDKMQRLPNNER